MQRGKILAVNVSENKGTKKTNIQSCALLKDFGLEGDAHAGPWHRQVSLLANESIEKMRAKGLNVGYGDFAENITTEGMDLTSLPLGSKLKAGEAKLEVIQIGKDPSQVHTYNYQEYSILPKEGIFCKVIESGEIKVGDSITVIRTYKVI